MRDTHSDARYNINRLVYCEQLQYIDNAIAREKELKKWTRPQKIALIEAAKSDVGRADAH